MVTGSSVGTGGEPKRVQRLWQAVAPTTTPLHREASGTRLQPRAEPAGPPAAPHLKFSAVLGTTSANSSIFMRPTSCRERAREQPAQRPAAGLKPPPSATEP